MLILVSMLMLMLILVYMLMLILVSILMLMLILVSILMLMLILVSMLMLILVSILMLMLILVFMLMLLFFGLFLVCSKNYSKSIDVLLLYFVDFRCFNKVNSVQLYWIFSYSLFSRRLIQFSKIPFFSYILPLLRSNTSI